MNIQFWSHAEEINGEIKGRKLLKDHLKEVSERCFSYVEKGHFEEQKQLLLLLARIIGLCHDFGKYTKFFQERLFKIKDHGIKSDHGFLSALFSVWYVFNKRDILNELKYAPLLAFFIVLHHHGDLGDLEEDLPSDDDLNDPPEFLNCSRPHLREKLKSLYNQIGDLQLNSSIIEKEMQENGIKFKIEDFKNNWIKYLRELNRLSYDLNNKENIEVKIKNSFIMYFLYSALIDADKRDAGSVRKIARREISPDVVDRYIEKTFVNKDLTPLNKMRSEIYKKVDAKIKNISLDKKIITLTAPTGVGKTLTGLNAALKLRDRLRMERGYTPKIIYSLPFINIIEQNYNVIRSILKEIIQNFNENESSYLIKHHHLADLRYKVANEKIPLDESLLLIESWESEIIVTTFVQFLYSVIAFKNNFLKKFHNIAGSIIILDEVQNIPMEYWNVVRNILKNLSSLFNCYIILMTATKPLIFDESDNPLELIDNAKNYFKREDINRTIIKRVDFLKQRELEEIIEIFCRNYANSKSYLIVLNTIDTSIQFYQKLKEKLCLKTWVEFEKDILENGEYEVFIKNILNAKIDTLIFYLSTNITPKQRFLRIEALKRFIQNNKKPILISTQVVEAGIDLDFDEVWRDLGPLDAIIQVAGRCNREKRQNCAHVKIFNSGKTSIYGKILPYLTKEIINKDVEEKNFFDLIDNYFKKSIEKKDTIGKLEIWEGILNWEFKSKVSKFNLFEEKSIQADIFVEIDKKAKDVWIQYHNRISNEKNYIKRKKLYAEIKKNLKNYVISILVNPNIVLPQQIGSIYYISRDNLNAFYSLETGFKKDIFLAF